MHACIYKYTGLALASQAERIMYRDKGKLLGVGKCNLTLRLSIRRSQHYLKRELIKYTYTLMGGHQQSGIIVTREARHKF